MQPDENHPIACTNTGIKAFGRDNFVAKRKRNEPHRITLQIQRAGAAIHFVPDSTLLEGQHR